MKLRGAFIGCGYFSQHHLAAWKRIPEVEIVAACDLEYDRAQKFADRAYRSADQMLESEALDFVDIATRADTHLALAALAAQRGISVICQKPIAPDWPTAVRLVETMEKAGVRFMVHENWRWQRWYRVAREMILHGNIGKPIGYGFRTRTRDGIGEQAFPLQPYMRRLQRFLIDEVLVHHFDTARFLFGDIASIYAGTGKLNAHVAGEDRAIVVLNHEEGINGTVDGHRFLNSSPDGPAMGEAVFEGDSAALWIPSTGDIYRNGVLAWRNDVSTGYRGDSVYATLVHFARSLIENTPFETDGREYLKTFAAVEAAYRSAAEHQMVALSEVIAPDNAAPSTAQDKGLAKR
jgi:predicted dehydrogenase